MPEPARPVDLERYLGGSYEIGRYNATQLQLTATLQSFPTLHDISVPFCTNLIFRSGDTTLQVTGAMVDPLNADGVDTQIALKADSLDHVLAIAGVNKHFEFPVTLAGTLKRQGDLWHLTGAKGSFHGHPFLGGIRQKEGARREPDDATLDAEFSVVDLMQPHQTGEHGEVSLRIDDNPGILLDAHVTAKQLIYGARQAEEVDLRAKVEPGALIVHPLAFRLAGGNARLDARVQNTKSSASARLEGSLIGASTGQLSTLLALGQIPLAGAVDAQFNFESTANTMTEALHSGHGVLTLSMKDGTVERKIIECISTDLRLLFRDSTGNAQIACLFGLLDASGENGRISSLRIKTSAGTIDASGTLNLRGEMIDVRVSSESASTDFFALDVPLRITGPLLNPDVTPVFGRAGPVVAGPLRSPRTRQDVEPRDPCLADARR